MKTTKVNEELLEVIEYLCEDRDCEMRPYSGRFMYGAECIGIVAKDASVITSLLMELPDRHPDMKIIAKGMASCVRYDNMGLNIIAYFPNYTY